MSWLWREIHGFWVLVAGDRIPSSINQSSIHENLEKKYWTPPHPKCCMRIVHFMPSNKENSDQMCLVMLMKTLTAMKELEALQKISCKVNRTSCSTTFLTKEVWNHQSQVGNKVSLSSTCKILTGYHRLAYIVLEINLLRLAIAKSMFYLLTTDVYFNSC